MNRQRKYFKSTLALSMLVVFIFPIIVSAFHIHNSEELSSHQLDHSDLHSFDADLTCDLCDVNFPSYEMTSQVTASFNAFHTIKQLGLTHLDQLNEVCPNFKSSRAPPKTI